MPIAPPRASQSLLGPVGLVLGHRLDLSQPLRLLSSKPDERLHVLRDGLNRVVIVVFLAVWQLIKGIALSSRLLGRLRGILLLVRVFDHLLAHVRDVVRGVVGQLVCLVLLLQFSDPLLLLSGFGLVLHFLNLCLLFLL